MQNLEKTLEPIMYLYKQQRRRGESFGDFCTRVGFLSLRTYSAGYVPQAAQDKLPAVNLEAELFARLQERANAEGKSIAHLASEAVRQYVI